VRATARSAPSTAARPNRADNVDQAVSRDHRFSQWPRRCRRSSIWGDAETGGDLFESGQAPTRGIWSLAHCHQRGAIWLEPRVVAEVSFGGSVESGLRDPVL
jgi:hypothetical protein